MNSEELVEHCEILCEAFDKLDKYVLNPPDAGSFCSNRLNKPATIANIRIYYYIEKVAKIKPHITNWNSSKELAYEKLSFLLLDPRSKFYDMTIHEQMLVLYQSQPEIYGHIFVFNK